MLPPKNLRSMKKMNIFREGNPFHGANNPFNKDYKPKPILKKKSPRKPEIERIEVINQRTGKNIADLAPGAVMGFAISLADRRDADDIDFIGLDRSGRTFDTWSLADVLAGHFVI